MKGVYDNFEARFLNTPSKVKLLSGCYSIQEHLDGILITDLNNAEYSASLPKNVWIELSDHQTLRIFCKVNLLSYNNVPIEDIHIVAMTSSALETEIRFNASEKKINSNRRKKPQRAYYLIKKLKDFLKTPNMRFSGFKLTDVYAPGEPVPVIVYGRPYGAQKEMIQQCDAILFDKEYTITEHEYIDNTLLIQNNNTGEYGVLPDYGLVLHNNLTLNIHAPIKMIMPVCRMIGRCVLNIHTEKALGSVLRREGYNSDSMGARHYTLEKRLKNMPSEYSDSFRELGIVVEKHY